MSLGSVVVDYGNFDSVLTDLTDIGLIQNTLLDIEPGSNGPVEGLWTNLHTEQMIEASGVPMCPVRLKMRVVENHL